MYWRYGVCVVHAFSIIIANTGTKHGGKKTPAKEDCSK
jgi:hypothetical protein